jgi:L-asparaginase / beta-aspartyl-peptidase
MKQKFALAIHGGSGTILRANLSKEAERAYLESLEQALNNGCEILKGGGSALDAVEVSVKILEDNPLFNAGKGAVFTSDGKNELDASIMDGSTLAAGSVAEVTIIKNPVSAARAVMEKSDHIMLVGKGAEKFARQFGLEIVDPEYFFTEERWNALQRVRAEDPSKTELDHDSFSDASKPKDEKFGTVGAVALDVNGNLAAATSTGGMTNKRFGRVGDSPIIGAGTYANKFAAISCTGWGEYFIRICAAKTVCDLIQYKEYSLKKAAKDVVKKQITRLGGDGGLIAVDRNGNVAMPFSTEGMYRGYITHKGKAVVKIFKD